MTEFSNRSKDLRNIILDIFERGGRGHVPSAFSLVEILSTLYFDCFDINPTNFNSPNRDRVLLSKGHGCLALYAVLYKLGFYSEDEFDKFCKVGGILGGHPTRGKVPGVEISAGSLGHGFSIGVGQAIALKRRNNDKKVIVILGDGECNEGSVWEAALSANKNNLDNLTVIIDYNKVQSYGATQDVCPLEPFSDKWKSFGFECLEVDMVKEAHELKDIINLKQTIPRAIICHTIKGQGSSIMESDNTWHHKNKISKDEIKILRDSLR
jgi:transketolase